MYNSISFETLHIHAGHDVDSNTTLSKTLAVYQTDLFIYHIDDFYESAKEIRSNIKEKSFLAKGSNSELYQHFVWHLN